MKKVEINLVIPVARELALHVLDAAAACGYEEMGVLNSEILFLCACIHPEAPPRIIESGRGRGQSTALLAKLFPKTEIISVELEKGTEHDRIARERLTPFENVQLLYGDSTKLLPRILRNDDVVLVDGPKGPAGVFLCLNACRAATPRMIFLHDTHHGQKERQLTDVFWRGAGYSDHPAYVAEFSHLDSECWKHISDHDIHGWEAPSKRMGEAQPSYGPTLACLPPMRSKDARWCIRELRRLGKRLRRWRP
ncbi:MAG: hypothetical protein K8I27_02605 [Planctomycetes bacterium]|nr:hypothetical protein [Planctomycetota bacterium]